MAGTSANSVAAWHVKDGSPAFAVPTSASVSCLDVSADGRKLIVGQQSSRNNIGLFALTSRGARAINSRQTRSSPRFVAFGDNSQRAVTVDSSGELVLWDLIKFVPIASQKMDSSVSSVRFAPNGKYVAVCTSSAIYLWNPNTHRIDDTLQGDSRGLSRMRDLQISPDGNHIYVADYYRGLLVWDVNQKKLVAGSSSSRIASSSQRYERISLLPDPRGAVVGDTSNGLSLLRLPDIK